MSVIKLTNDVKISSNSLMQYIDSSNVLSTFDNEGSYTATEDAIVFWWGTRYDGNMSHGYYYQWLDNVQLLSVSQFGADKVLQIPLKKGQVFAVTNYNSSHTNTCRTIIYGLK